MYDIYYNIGYDTKHVHTAKEVTMKIIADLFRLKNDMESEILICKLLCFYGNLSEYADFLSYLNNTISKWEKEQNSEGNWKNRSLVLTLQRLQTISVYSMLLDERFVDFLMSGYRYIQIINLHSFGSSHVPDNIYTIGESYRFLELGVYYETDPLILPEIIKMMITYNQQSKIYSENWYYSASFITRYATEQIIEINQLTYNE